MSDAELQAIRDWLEGEQTGTVYHAHPPGPVELVGQAWEHVRDLLAEVDRLRQDLAAVQRVAAGLADRVAAQSELLAKRAEKPAPFEDRETPQPYSAFFPLAVPKDRRELPNEPLP